MRAAVNGHPFLLSETLTLSIPAEERHARYEKAWEVGGLRFRAVFRDLVTSNEANATAVTFLKDKIRKIVKDPATAEKLADIDHPYAAKRPPIDTDYFETFNRDNVALVDVRADPIERVTPTGIRLKSGAEHPLDIIVFATGFDGMTGSHPENGHSRPRWVIAEGSMESGPAQLSGPAGCGIPEPVHGDRAGQPVRSVQYAGRHRAAR